MDDILINGTKHKLSFIQKGDYVAKTQNERAVFLFIQAWLNGQKEFIVFTSGSTGKPKEIKITREQMLLSAHKTGEFLGLNKGDRALVCLSAEYIAGKMMLVRCLELELKTTVIDACSNPFLIEQQAYDFIALVPLQVTEIIENPISKKFFHQTKNCIIGGAPLNLSLEKQLVGLPNAIYQTYGMTETVSHIALRSVSDGEQVYQALPGVKFSTDERNCLQINAPMAIENPLVTNDVVELISETSFVWKGRADFVINTGGVKVQIEEVERTITDVFGELGVRKAFFVFAQKDEVLGEQVCLCLEGQKLDFDVLKKVAVKLPRYHSPKQIFYLDELVYTKTGKLDRRESVDRIKGTNKKPL